MGVVLKSHDPDLGRDVAMKVLREEVAESPEAVHRFVEEAQVGGQLQHPGIVPVYDLGLCEDGRPYFTMKLVKGRTLAALLGDRVAPSDGRSHLLDVFEAICQTMAYAHSRGVIHRDLKPANVLIGAFGEVQVVDWGLAKVLPRGGDGRRDGDRGLAPMRAMVATVRSDGSAPNSPSLYGAVMGTPSYMPPEQARGEVDRLDERTDVFALGALLFEILTGEPPYGGSTADALARAAEASLSEAHERLGRCGADPELIELARDCLDPAPLARPRSAEVLAKRVRSYLEGVQDRAHAASIELAEARGKAEEERRARRRTVAMAALVVVTALLGTIGILRARLERSERERRTTTEVQAALSEADLHLEAGRWDRARSAAGRARALVQAGEASAGLRLRTLERFHRVEEAHATHLRRIAFEAKQAALVEEIEWLRGTEHGAEGDRVPARYLRRARVEAYREFYHSLGLEPGGSLERAAGKLVSLEIPVALAAGLDGWASALLALHGGPTERSRWLTELACRIDEDPERRGVRAALLTQDLRALHALAARSGDLPSETTLSLAAALLDAGLEEEGRTTLELLVDRAPAEFSARVELGLHYAREPGTTTDAVRELTVAVALRPDSLVALNNLAYAHGRDGQPGTAVHYYRKAVALAPEDAFLRRNLGIALRSAGDLAAAADCFREALRLNPEDTRTILALARHLHAAGSSTEAAEHYRSALALGIDAPSVYNELGTCLHDLGLLEEAEEFLRLAVEGDPDSSMALNNLGLTLEDLGRTQEALDALTRAEQITPGRFETNVSLGRVLHTLGRYLEATGAYRAAIAVRPDYATAHANLGTALEALGEEREALEALRTAIRLNPDFPYALSALGRILVMAEEEELRQPAEALRLLLRAQELNGGLELASAFHLAIAHHGNGELDEAERWLRLASSSADAAGAEELRPLREEAERRIFR